MALKHTVQIENHVLFFEDVHEMDFHSDKLGKGWKSIEIAYGESVNHLNDIRYIECYWGLFYRGRQPAKSKIRTLLEEAGFNFNCLDSDLYF